MKKYFRSLAILLITIILMNITIINVYASEKDNMGRVVDGSLLTDKTEVEDTVTVLTRGNILNKGTAKCANGGNGEVIATGATVAHVVCDTLSISLSLDQYDPSIDDWFSIKTWSDTKNDASLFTKSHTVPVEKGHWYRVRGIHGAEKGETYESVATTTDGIWIE